ncbi:polypeptide N-acetylgalactosaminyltransferase 16-like [Gigantopelta aegis]|uniref:polypeptide N-acetylgalactosaminyltransferase 16-like n=1 Tax=Gigantopelta aegis TaxID=1735272 RepID=UPI001B889BAE|nr:polypeptide N-acetylgalactosaminyltransferase 16-like [Gigantopelta aegis]
MKISACCIAIRKWIRYGRQLISVGILLSLWVTMLLLFDVLSEHSLWTNQMGYDNQVGYDNHISHKWTKLKLQHLNLSKKNRSSSFVKRLAGEIEAVKTDDIKIQGLYRGSVRKIESIGLEQSNGGNMNLQETTNGKTIPGDRKERNLTRIQDIKNSHFSPGEGTVGNHTDLIRSKCSRVKSRNEFSRCIRKIGYQTRQKDRDQQVNSHKQRTTLPHEKTSTPFPDSFAADNSHKKTQVSSHSDSVLSSQIDGTNLGEPINFYSNDIDKETFLKLKQDGFLDYSYNVTASDKLDLDRHLPDVRPHSCRHNVRDTSVLPKASVIISFHNEAPSVLLRTVSSVVTRSAPSLLQEVILVDDNSSKGAVDRSFEDALRLWPKVKLVRTSRREGLVRARLFGASQATGSVLVFLDSHCECNTHWLEPLLQAVFNDKKKIASPYIDAIKADSFEYVPAPDNLHGAFTWRLEFVWKGIPPHVVQHRTSSADPIKSPVISGGLFAVYKNFFFSLGSYDDNMEIWGGENLELSFRAWMCGGSMEILPCSRVGHVFRNLLPYKFPGDGQTTLLRNLGRVAEVWMDQYKETFFSAVDFPRSVSLGNLTSRHHLRKTLHCRPFQWYLDNVIPELVVPPSSAVVFGEFRNRASLTCLTLSKKSAKQTDLELSACLGDSINQLSYISHDGHFHHGSHCLVTAPNKGLSLGPCKHHRWLLMENHIQLNGTDLCVTGVDNEFVALRQCSREDTSQMWDTTYHFQRDRRHV